MTLACNIGWQGLAGRVDLSAWHFCHLSVEGTVQQPSPSSLLVVSIVKLGSPLSATNLGTQEELHKQYVYQIYSWQFWNPCIVCERLLFVAFCVMNQPLFLISIQLSAIFQNLYHVLNIDLYVKMVGGSVSVALHVLQRNCAALSP